MLQVLVLVSIPRPQVGLQKDHGVHRFHSGTKQINIILHILYLTLKEIYSLQDCGYSQYCSYQLTTGLAF